MLRTLALIAFVSFAAISAADADRANGLPDLKNLTAADIGPKHALILSHLRARGAKGEFVVRTGFTDADIDDLSMAEQSYFNDAAWLKRPKGETSNWMISGDALALQEMYCQEGLTPDVASKIVKIGDLEYLELRGFSNADRQCYQAATRRSATLAPKPAPLPADVQKYVGLEGSCAHWEGEEGYDAERAAEIKRNLRGCDRMPAMERSLRQKYRGNKAILSAMDDATFGG